MENTMGGKKNEQFNVNILLNMILASFIAMFLGMFLKLFALPCWFVCGMVAVGAVIAEHFLTIHPLDLLERCKVFCRKVKEKVSSWKN